MIYAYRIAGRLPELSAYAEVIGGVTDIDMLRELGKLTPKGYPRNIATNPQNDLANLAKAAGFVLASDVQHVVEALDDAGWLMPERTEDVWQAFCVPKVETAGWRKQVLA